MPELPEVEFVRRLLSRAMAGARITRAIARRPDLRYPLPVDFAARLEGTTVGSVQRRAKYLLVELSSGEVLVMHLGMSGWFRVARGTGRELSVHDHVVFEMSSGAVVVFSDPRRFGSMRIVARDRLASDPALGALGPEPLGAGFNAASLARLLKGRQTSLKAALSDQRVAAGLGNIYVSEALHRARLSPRRRASTLATRSGAPRPAADALADAIKAVLEDALANRHQAGAADRFRVYDREGRRCRRRGCHGIISRIVQAGRATFFCPVCQR